MWVEIDSSWPVIIFPLILPLILPLSLSASSLSINSHKSTVHLPFKIPKITPYPHLYQCLSIHRDPTLAAQAEGWNAGILVHSFIHSFFPPTSPNHRISLSSFSFSSFILQFCSILFYFTLFYFFLYSPTARCRLHPRPTKPTPGGPPSRSLLLSRPRKEKKKRKEKEKDRELGLLLFSCS